MRTWLREWRAPIIGVLIGLVYGSLASVIDLEAMKAPRLLLILDGIWEILIPMMLGGLSGMAFNDVRRHARTNRILSTQNAKLQGELITHLLGSHILHEVRNPLHNLTAVLEEWQQRVPPEEASMIQRNLLRLQAVTTQLSRWSSLRDAIDPRQAIAIGAWLEEFLSDKVRPQLHEAAIKLEEELAPVIVEMHPLLLEQCFVALFNNAFEAVAGHDLRVIRLSTKPSQRRHGYVEIEIRNTGTPFPEAVLTAQQTQPVSDHGGSGLGLLLVRKTLEQVGGALLLENVQGEARTLLWIPGHAL